QIGDAIIIKYQTALILAPGADPSGLIFDYDGVTDLQTDSSGDLILRSGENEFRQHKPKCYQKINGVNQEVPANYVIHINKKVHFQLSSYDSRVSLVVDPVLS